MMRLECECRAHGNRELIYLDEILTRVAPPGQRTRANPHRWPVTVYWKNVARKLAPVPDKIFGIRFTDLPDGSNTKYFFLEIDRSTETQVSRSLDGSSIVRKFLEYAYSSREGLHKKFYGFNNARALFVTRSTRRMENMIRRQEEFTRGICPGGTFLFTDAATLDAHNILTLPWVNGRREFVQLSPEEATGVGYGRRRLESIDSRAAQPEPLGSRPRRGDPGATRTG